MSPTAEMPVMPVLVVSVGSCKWSPGAVLHPDRDTGGPGRLRRGQWLPSLFQVSAQRAGKIQEVPILRMHPHSGSKALSHVSLCSSTLLWKPGITVAGLGICQLTVFSAVNTSLLKFKASQKKDQLWQITHFTKILEKGSKSQKVPFLTHLK